MPDTMMAVVELLQKQIGFSAGALYQLGAAPFQPDDRQLKLTAVRAQGTALHLSFTFTMGGEGDYEVVVEQPEGVKVGKSELVISRAASVKSAWLSAAFDAKRKLVLIEQPGGGVEEFSGKGVVALRIVAG